MTPTNPLSRNLRRWEATLSLVVGALTAMPAVEAQFEPLDTRNTLAAPKQVEMFSGTPAGEERRRERAGFYVFLKLPPERASRLEALQSDVERQSRVLQGRLRERSEDLEQLYRSYRYDEEACRRLQRVIRDTQDQLLELHHRFQRELRAILTEGEFNALQQNLREMRERRLEPAQLERELASARERVGQLERRQRELASAPERSSELEWVQRELRTARNRVAELESQWRALRSEPEQRKRD